METKRVLEKDNSLPIREDLVSLHAINPFIGHCSSSRSYMFSAHMSQALAVEGVEEKIIQTGIEHGLANNTFSVKTGKDPVKVLKAIRRYRGILTADGKDCTVEILYITRNLNTGEIDYISVPEYFSLQNGYGFKYDIKSNIINNIIPETILEPETVLADSKSVFNNKGYGFGVNANACLLSIPETAEDGIIISDSLASKLRYRVYEERTIEFGLEYFPLNLYGDKDNYKPFPSIGDVVREDGLVGALRKYDNKLSTALTSVNDTMEVNPVFDKCFYVKSGGKMVSYLDDIDLTKIHTVPNSKVIDIKVLFSQKYKKNVYTKVADSLNPYIDSTKLFYKDLLEYYEELKRENYNLGNNEELKLSKKLHRLIIEAMAIASKDSNRNTFTFKSDPIDIYRVTITIEHLVIPSIGSKLSNLHGAKGVIIQVLPWDKMPIDPVTGERADLIQDATSINSRMNVSWLYEMYFNATSRHTKRLIQKELNIKYKLPLEPIVRDLVSKSNNIDNAFNILLGLLKIIDSGQYETYSKANREQKIEVLTECLVKEVFIFYRVGDNKTAYQIVRDIKNSIYYPSTNPIVLRHTGKDIVTKNKVRIAPSYTMLLSKTANTYLAIASSKTNHYGLPIGISSANRQQLPWRASPCRTISETEGRLYTAYVSRYGMAELKDRANSPDTHKEIYRNILEADKPTNIDSVVDRNKTPYGGDVILHLINNIFNSAGTEISYVKDK